MKKKNLPSSKFNKSKKFNENLKLSKGTEKAQIEPAVNSDTHGYRFIQLKNKWFSNKKILGFILMIGFILRILPILWGVPLSSFVSNYHPDESKAYNMTFSFPEVYKTDNRFITYGTSLSYSLGFLLLPVKSVMVYKHHNSDGYKILVILASRLLSVIMSVATIAIVYHLAKMLFDEKIALLSSALLSVSFYHTLNSPLATLDVPMSFILTLNFWIAFKAYQNQSIILYVVSGICTAYLAGTKIPGILFMAIPLLLIASTYLSPKNDAINFQGRLKLDLKLLSIYAATTLIIFFVFHPHIFLNPGRYIQVYGESKHLWVDRMSQDWWSIMKAWTKSTSTALGDLVMVSGVIGMLMTLISKQNKMYKLTMISYILFYYCLWRAYLPPRFIITIAPLFCIFSASMIFALIRYRMRLVRYTGYTLTFLALTLSIQACSMGVQTRLNDTRPAVAKFIYKNVPGGASIGVCGVSEQYQWTTHSWRYPQIDFKRYKIINFLSEPEYIILNSYDSKQILNTLNSDKLQPNFVLPEKYHREWYRYSAPSPRIFRFYDDLLVKHKSKYQLFMTFPSNVNVPIEFPPPEIRIYKRMNAKKNYTHDRKRSF